MGSLEGEADEAPPRQVSLPAFYIDKLEVTHEQYARFLSATGRPAPVDWPGGKMPPKLARYPVVNVTWDDATAYARWAGKRLPTEAEWEKAARGTDGRVYPWGNSAAGRKVGSGADTKEHLWPVGSFPDDLSPYGVMDLAGNAWEWTASWYEAYPGQEGVELEQGHKFRVIRGGGAIDYYGAVSSRRCADRARSTPYGTYDALGFRCVMDVPKSAANPIAGDKPRANASAKTIPLTITETAGFHRRGGPVTSGVPFPMGVLRTNTPVRLLNSAGAEVPCQSAVLATWRDGSVKWLLLDFQTDLRAGERGTLTLDYSGTAPSRAAGGPGVSVTLTPDQVQFDTGVIEFGLRRDASELFHTVTGRWSEGGAAPVSLPGLGLHLEQEVALAKELAGSPVRIQPPEEVVVEESGPVRAVVRMSGWIDDGATNRWLRYLLRLEAGAGSSVVRLEHTVVQMNPRLKLLWLADLSLRLRPEFMAMAECRLGGASRPWSGDGRQGGRVVLSQLRENSYEIRYADGKAESGVRAPGWVEVSTAGGGVLVVNRFLEREYPKVLEASTNGLRFGLLPREAGEPFDFDQGLAKTHDLWFDFHAGRLTPEQAGLRARALAQPLFAIAPLEWYCAAKVFGELAPFNFDLFPEYETLTEASGDKYIKAVATGWRNWGDFYYGGPYKGKNAFGDLEYDMPHNFLAQFARTGQRKYLDMAHVMARHQADIDVNHFTGWQWKHSPRHTETQAEFGHTFTRGLLEDYFLTGRRRSLEAALELGGFFARDIRNPRALGNERQIGWALISLLPVYEATWDRRYFDAAKETVDRLLAGLDARGKFDIRWDNRIAFFNGIAATGLLYFYRATGDEAVAEAALKVIRRTLGMYPEYLGRTLEALAWAYQRTGQTNYLDALKLSYEATLARCIAWNGMELGAATIFTSHALPFMEQAGLAKPGAAPLDLTPAQFDSANGLQVHHLPGGTGDLFWKITTPEPCSCVLIRKGAWKAAGEAVLYDPEGRVAARLDYPREAVLWQRQTLTVPARPAGTWRLALRSPSLQNVRAGSYVTWDIATAVPLPTVFRSDQWSGLEFVTPRLFTLPKPDATKIEIELTGEGEGFKRAVLYDPTGAPAATAELFLDLDDKNRHACQLSAPVLPAHQAGLWSLSLQDLSVKSLSGLCDYFATSPESFFPLESR